MADDNKKAAKHAEEIAKKGYDEDALTDDQKAALKREAEFEKEAEKFQKSDDPADVTEQRQQV